VDSIYDIVWARDPSIDGKTTGHEVRYGDVRLADELHFSVYNFEAANIDFQWSHFNQYERECTVLIEGYWSAKTKKADELVRLGLKGLVDATGNAIEANRYPLLAAYDLCFKCSHLFNILDARGALSVTERVRKLTWISRRMKQRRRNQRSLSLFARRS
jgi:glycyl-tRNA synthetase alpha chain